MRPAPPLRCIAVLLCAISVGGCELVVGGYAVGEGGAGGSAGGVPDGGGGGIGGGSPASCAGLPVLREWSFEEPDPLVDLVPLGTLGGEVQAGQLVFDYGGATPGPGGRTFALPAGSTRASVCLAAQWDQVFDSQTMLLSSLEHTWTSGEYCGFFLALTNAGSVQLFAIATVNGTQVALADEQGSLVPAGTPQTVELLVDPSAGVATGRIGQAETSVHWLEDGFDQCPATPSNVVMTIGSDLAAPGEAVLALDDLVTARSTD
ncbi:MAG: hypothetical protein RIF41_07225 [Polyangiaceae bacterium]